MDPEDGFPADRRRLVRALVKMDMTDTIPRRVKLSIAEVETRVELWFEKIPGRICSLCRIIEHPHERCVDGHLIPQELVDHLNGP